MIESPQLWWDMQFFHDYQEKLGLDTDDYKITLIFFWHSGRYLNCNPFKQEENFYIYTYISLDRYIYTYKNRHILALIYFICQVDYDTVITLSWNSPFGFHGAIPVFLLKPWVHLLGVLPLPFLEYWYSLEFFSNPSIHYFLKMVSPTLLLQITLLRWQLTYLFHDPGLIWASYS